MSKLKGFVAACALVLAVGALLAGVCTDNAQAGGVVFFIDAQHGWESTTDVQIPGAKATAWRTSNGGASWKQLATRPCAFTEGNGVTGGFFAFATRSSGIWVRASRTVLRTTNAGTSWRSIGWVAPRAGSGWLTDASFVTSRVGWACSQTEWGSATGGSIMKTSNAGASWHVQKRLAGWVQSSGFQQVSCPTTSSCYVLGNDSTSEAVWATADGGKHWTRRQLPRGTNWTSISFPTATNGWAVGPGESNGSVIRTRNGGRTWSYYRSGSAFYGISFCNPEVGFAVGAYGMVSRTTNGGSKWTDLEGPDPNGADLSEVTCVDATHVWVTDVNGNTYVSADGGSTWNWNSVYPPSNDGE